MHLQSGTFRLSVPSGKAKVYAERGYAGREVVSGTRPSDVHDAEYRATGIAAQNLECRVDVTELVGGEMILYLLTGSHGSVARVDPRSGARVGHTMTVVLNMDRMHIFDRHTGMAIR